MLISHFGNGVSATFPLPGAAAVASVTVNGGAATISSSTPFSVTLSAIPAKNSAVVITYTPSNEGIREAYTWATKPSAVQVPVGTIIRISDVGPAPGIRVWSDGTRWVPVGAQLLARGTTAQALTGSTAKTTQASFVVPAGAMGLNGGLDIRAAWTLTNNANAKTLRGELGAMLALQVAGVSATGAQSRTIVRNRNSATAQIGFAPGSFGIGSTTASSPATGTENTANDVTFNLSAQLGVGTDTATLESWEAWLLP